MSMLDGLKSLLERADNHPIIQKIKEDQANETLDKRVKAAAAIKELEIERDSKVKELREDLQAKEGEHTKNRQLLERVTKEYQQSRANLLNENNRFERDIEQQRAILLKSYDPAIDEALEHFRSKIDWLRQSGRINHQSQGAELNIVSLTKVSFGLTNRPAILQTISYCRMAIVEIECMKFSPELDKLRLESLRSRVPDIEVYSEVTSDGFMDRGPGSPIPPVIL